MIFLRGAQFIVPTIISFAIVLTLAFAYHEFAHAIVADRLGDPTPRSAGRITFNPIAHLDRTVAAQQVHLVIRSAVHPAQDGGR